MGHRQRGQRARADDQAPTRAAVNPAREAPERQRREDPRDGLGQAAAIVDDVEVIGHEEEERRRAPTRQVVGRLIAPERARQEEDGPRGADQPQQIGRVQRGRPIQTDDAQSRRELRREQPLEDEEGIAEAARHIRRPARPEPAVAQQALGLHGAPQVKGGVVAAGDVRGGEERRAGDEAQQRQRDPRPQRVNQSARFEGSPGQHHPPHLA